MSKVQSEFIVMVIWPINSNSLNLSKLSPKIITIMTGEQARSLTVGGWQNALAFSSLGDFY